MPFPRESPFVAVLVVVMGCTVGEVPLGNNSNNNTNTKMDAPAPACVDLGPVNAAHLHTDDNTSKAGQDCLAGGCHLAGNTGLNAPAYTAAGTAYALDRITPSPGANILVINMGETFEDAIRMVADDAGNFYTGQTIQFPAQTNATVCPGNTPMITPLTSAADGACSRAGCHVTVGGSGVIYVQ
ncbi:MAG: hypothetical protein AB7P03_25835 [Kofleriaceae bacterium]